MCDQEEITAEDRIENAAQEAASTHRSWEDRCHAILSALGLDFGGPTPDMPEVGSYLALKLQRLESEVSELQLKNIELRVQLRNTNVDL